MKKQPLMLAAVMLLCACGSEIDDGYAIDLKVSVDSTVSDTDLARITKLELTVSGAESYLKEIPVADKLGKRTAGLRYKPGAQSGKLSFNVDAVDDQNHRIASGSVHDVELKPGATQVFTLTIGASSAECGNGLLDSGEACDSGPGSTMPCPQSAADCDDQNTCTKDSLSGQGCQATCTHEAVTGGCGSGAGVCVDKVCCMGCVKNGVCMPGNSDKTACGSGGNDCFDCTMTSATSTCNAGQCSGCDASSCAADGRTCGTSSCGYNCGGCADSCVNGAITKYACVNKSCQMNGGGNCGQYAACASSSTCKSSCVGDGDCVATAFCGNGTCKPKVGLGGVCSAESTGDHECASPYVCSWAHDAKNGRCVTTRCTGCWAATDTGACNGYIDVFLDPRNACQGYAPTDCHQNYCAGFVGDPTVPNGGDPATCDVGNDPNLNPRPCGAGSTCTPEVGGAYPGAGIVTGSLCGASGACVANKTFSCVGERQGCWPCNVAKTTCDYSRLVPNCN